MISTPARKVIAPISSGILRPPWLSGAAFNPISIISASDDGAFYLHKDYSTLWQESTKTTQVSDVEQYIGYRADLSEKGNHSSVVTSTERPLLSARVNLFRQSNNFDDSFWIKTGINSIIGGIFTENTGTNTHFIRSSDPQISGNTRQYLEVKNYSGSRYLVLRPHGLGAGISYLVFDLVNNVIDSATGTEFVSASATQLSDDYYALELYSNYSLPPTAAQIKLSDDGTETTTYLGDGSSGALIRYADYRAANLDHLPYQWVNTATDYDTSGYFPRYLSFDGVDDNLTTTWTNADTSTWTLARSIPGVGAQISTGQTFGSTTPFVDSTNSYAVFLIDRALTAKETADLTYYLNKLAGF